MNNTTCQTLIDVYVSCTLKCNMLSLYILNGIKNMGGQKKEIEVQNPNSSPIYFQDLK